MQNAELLPETAYVEGIDIEWPYPATLIEGIINYQGNETVVGLVNENDVDITVEDGQELGPCHPIVEDLYSTDTLSSRCAAVLNDTEKHNSSLTLLPDHWK